MDDLVKPPKREDFKKYFTKRLYMSDGTRHTVLLEQLFSGVAQLVQDGHDDDDHYAYPELTPPKQIGGLVGVYKRWFNEPRVSPSDYLKARGAV